MFVLSGNASRNLTGKTFCFLVNVHVWFLITFVRFYGNLLMVVFRLPLKCSLLKNFQLQRWRSTLISTFQEQVVWWCHAKQTLKQPRKSGYTLSIDIVLVLKLIVSEFKLFIFVFIQYLPLQVSLGQGVFLHRAKSEEDWERSKARGGLLPPRYHLHQ